MRDAVAVSINNLQRDNLVLKLAIARCSCCFALALECEGVEFLLRKLILLGNHLRAVKLAEHRHSEARFNTPGQGAGANAVLHRQRGRETHRHADHGFDASGDHYVLGAAHYRLGGEVYGFAETNRTADQW